ncbi:uncharacterized protein LOC126997189 [Eriocheir sinensis]|uniref:uncharacterized protein LOC126997189 n=1 Tax=Eriocheir sinensis TaxID=95602 RepID=UPI0021C9793A|nr:uncharacterized protein LOC126997189 [Eriocheir sinensis]
MTKRGYPNTTDTDDAAAGEDEGYSAHIEVPGHHKDARGLLYHVKHLKSTRVVTVKDTITKYLTCTASKPPYLPYCREHRAFTPIAIPLHRTQPPPASTRASVGQLEASLPQRTAAGRFLAKVHHTHVETYTDTHVHTHTDYRSTVTLIYNGCVPHDAPKVPECPEPHKTHAGHFKPCVGVCEGHCRGVCDGNCFGTCDVVAARACSGDCLVPRRQARQDILPCLGTCYGHCDGTCDGLCDSTCVPVDK